MDDISPPTTPVRFYRGVPVYRYAPALDRPPVSLAWPDARDRGVDPRRHIHDFPILLTNCVDAWIVAPGQVIDPTNRNIGNDCAALIFDPAAVDDELCVPFRHDSPTGLAHLGVPEARQARWHQALRDIDAESNLIDTNSRRALIAHLTILLTDVARISAAAIDLPDDTIAQVFSIIEDRYTGPLSLPDVAAQVGLSPAYLTTLVRKRTGKTVAQWIISRRMLAARRLLAQTDAPIATVAGRVGFDDPAYFSRLFRREVGMAPRAWRGSAQAE